jgi:S-adenosyl-L-methionine hydrolase (adenosine-forming)
VIPCLVPPIITLTTDFGLTDAYVGVMKGVILAIEPSARIVDISHQVTPQNIAEGSFLLLSAYPYFPADTIHVGVVDPGVGTSRAPLAIATPGGTFVGPDNGLFAPILVRQGLVGGDGRLLPSATAVELRDQAFRLPRVSSTFHGRDIFAPAAAHLAHGVQIEELGPRREIIELGSQGKYSRGPDGMIHGEIVHIDHFGNAISNIPAEALSPDSTVCAGGREIGPVVQTYQTNDVVALVGSAGLLEISVRNGSAREQLGLRVGDQVQAFAR